MLISDWSSDVCSSDLVRKLLDLNRWAVRGQLLFENGNVTNRVIAEHYETSEYNNFYSPFADVNTLNDGTVRNGWERKMRTLFGMTRTMISPTMPIPISSA